MEINHKSNHLNFLLKPNFIWFFLCIVILFTLSTIRYEHFAAKRNFGDFHVYYVTGERVLKGKPIYVDETETVTPYKYSPLVASFFALLALAPEAVAAGIWHVINLTFLMGSLIICIRLVGTKSKNHAWPNRRETAFALLGLTGVSPLVLHCLNSGQVGIAIFFFYLVSVYFAKGDQETAGGFFLALSAMFKYLPILVLPYYWLRGRRRFVFSVACWLVVLHMIPALWFGTQRNLHYLSSFLPFLFGTTIDHVSFLDFKNQSVWSYLYRLLYYEGNFFTTGIDLKFLMILGGALFVALYAVIVFSGKRDHKKYFVIDTALLGILIVIFNPNAWKHNFVFLLFPYLFLLFKLSSGETRKRKVLVLLLASLLIFSSNRDLLGWGLRFELMSASVLLLAALLLFTALIFDKQSISASG